MIKRKEANHDQAQPILLSLRVVHERVTATVEGDSALVRQAHDPWPDRCEGGRASACGYYAHEAVKPLKVIVSLSEAEGEKFHQAIGETYRLIEIMLNMVSIRLGDIQISKDYFTLHLE